MANTVPAEYCNDFFLKMSQHRSCGRFCDVEIQVGEEVFNCHRHILSLASNYFDVMFGGNFCESSSQKVVLGELDVGVFKVMLNFIYTGEAELCSSNLYDIIRAADFYQLPHLAEHSRIYMQENLNALADQIWNIFLYARKVRIEPIGGLLKRHIRENFAYFSNAPEFVTLNVDILFEIWEVGAEDCTPLLQDVFFEGIYTWIRHQENLNPDQKESYFDRFCNEIDFTQLSAQYTRDWLPERKAVLASQAESADCGIHTAGVVQSCPKLLRAYVSIVPHYQFASVGTMVFSGFSGSNPSSWIYSGNVIDCFSKYMKNIVIGDRLYSLGLSSEPRGENPKQTFRFSNSISMYPYTSLSLPPFVTEWCDMCGTANEIYLYKKKGNVTMDREPEKHLYSYKRDIDRWFPLPSPKVNVSFASVTYKEERLYLVGGDMVNKNLIQAIDVRTREWTKLPHTSNDYLNPACCIYGKEVCILDGFLPAGEMYDPTSGKSRPLKRIYDTDLPFCPYLENCADIFLQGGNLCDETIKRFYVTPDKHGWIPLPKLSDAVARVEGIPQDVNHHMLDVFLF